MAVRFTTIEKNASAEQVIERSRFLAGIWHVESREEADAIIRSVRAQYRDATHNVPAMVIGEHQELQWGSDDGEPQGTSGAPIVQMLVKEGVTNVLVVVTRWFGGIKLGTGGLVRAYTGCAKQALDAAGRHEVRDVLVQEIDVPYGLLDKLTNLEKNLPFNITETAYTDRVRLTIEYAPEDAETVMEALMELTGGRLDSSPARQEIR